MRPVSKCGFWVKKIREGHTLLEFKMHLIFSKGKKRDKCIYDINDEPG
jgi:hypothetical protein